MTDQLIVLDNQLLSAWKNQDPFEWAEKLSGKIFREFANRKTLRFELNGKGYFIKIHRGIGLIETFKNYLTGKQPVWGANQEWLAIHKLQALGIDTMTPVAVGVRGHILWQQTSFIITEELTNTISLEDVGEQWKSQPPCYAKKKALIEKVATISQQLHHHGVNHCDYYICHFLLPNNGSVDNGKPPLFLIDLHRTQIRAATPSRWIIKDLGSLYFSAMDIGLTRNDMMRFMKTYTHLPLRQALKQQNFWESVRARAIILYKKEFGILPVLSL